jgi:4-hydroxy-4-methyl-2-oxoglutarate aldolase
LSETHIEAASATRPTQADLDLFAHLEQHLYTAVVSDALDDLGFRECAMADHLRPVGNKVKFAGWARTIVCMDTYHIGDDPYGTEIDAIDSILPGEVVVVATGSSKRNAPWGELLSTAATARGARGAIVDGLVRDVLRIQEIGFGLFAAGIKPVDSKGRGLVMAYNQPALCGGVLVSPGDLVFADYDGVLAIPAVAIKDAVRLATEKAQRENHSRAELQKGAYLRDVYNKYGVL